MDVVNLLPKRVFTEYLKRIRMMLPDGMFMISLARLATQLKQRTLEIILFEVLNNSPRRDTIQQP